MNPQAECNGRSRQRFISRRDLLFQAGGGISGIAFSKILYGIELLIQSSAAES